MGIRVPFRILFTNRMQFHLASKKMAYGHIWQHTSACMPQKIILLIVNPYLNTFVELSNILDGEPGIVDFQSAW